MNYNKNMHKCQSIMQLISGIRFHPKLKSFIRHPDNITRISLTILNFYYIIAGDIA